MDTVPPAISAQRIVWLDTTRLFAMFLLVCCHSADPFNFYAGSGESLASHLFWGAVWGSALRPCVPLFVMITGALLLPVRQNISLFYRHRISRVLWPFIIWSVLYNMFPWFLSILGQGPKTLGTFFPYAADTPMTLSYALTKIAEIPLNFTPVACHMWYIYLVIGLYLYLPIFSAWVEKASDRAKLLVLAIWAITLFLPYYRYFVNPYVWGQCAWNAFDMLYYFAGFNGYLLLGHFLRHHTISARKCLVIGLPAFLTGYLVTYFGFSHMRALPDCTDPMMELFFTYNSVNVLLMTVPVFWLAQHINISNKSLQNLLCDLTLCGFGIYMIHYFLIGPSFVAVNSLGLPLPLQIPFSAILTFTLSWLLVHFLKKAFGKHLGRILLG